MWMLARVLFSSCEIEPSYQKKGVMEFVAIVGVQEDGPGGWRMVQEEEEGQANPKQLIR